MTMDLAPNTSETVDLKETVAVLLRRRWIVAGTTAAITALAILMSMAQTPSYTSTAEVVIRPVVPPAALNSYGYSTTGPLGTDLTPDSEAQIARSAVVANEVAKDLGVGTAARMPGSIGVKVVTDQLLAFTGSSTNPAMAARIAQTFAEDYLQYRRDTAQQALDSLSQQYKSQIDGLNKQIGDYNRDIIDASQQAATQSNVSARQAAIARYNQLTSDRSTAQLKLASAQQRYQDVQSSMTTAATGGGEVVQPAAVPAAPSSPKPLRNGVLGFMFGLVLGVGVAFLRQHFDDRIRDLSDASRAAGTLVLGVIPRSKEWKDETQTKLESVDEPNSASAEAYRSLRQALSVMGIGKELKTVLITSGAPGEAKTTTAANLGVAFARAGLRTVLVSADIRRPRLHMFFGVDNSAGLTEILAGRLALETVAPTRVPNLWVLPSGAIASNPSELLDGTRLAETLDKLKGVADVVIIDGPPLAAGADAVVLSRHADTTLLLMRQDRARAGGAKAAVEELQKAGAARLAAVLTLAHGKLGGYGYGKYGYGYGGYGGYEQPRATEPVAAMSLAPGEMLEPARIDAASAPMANGHSNGNGSNGNGRTTTRKAVPVKKPRANKTERA
jgi:capsular exopolysaccharide synthesis family protein